MLIPVQLISFSKRTRSSSIQSCDIADVFALKTRYTRDITSSHHNSLTCFAHPRTESLHSFTFYKRYISFLFIYFKLLIPQRRYVHYSRLPQSFLSTQVSRKRAYAALGSAATASTLSSVPTSASAACSYSAVLL